MKLEYTRSSFSKEDADRTVMDHPEWFLGAGAEEERPGTLDYYGPQHVGVHIVAPLQAGADPERDGVILIPRSYEATYGIDGRADLEGKRDAVIANVLGKFVIGYDTPGFGMNPDAEQRTGQILTAALSGSMRPHAKAQLEAIVAAMKREGIYDEKREKQLQLEFIGYSMANIAVVDTLGQLGKFMPGAKVTGITLAEAVNDKSMGLPTLLGAIGRETNEVNTNRYFEDDRRHGLAVGYDRQTYDVTQYNQARLLEQKAAKKRGNVTNVSIGAGMRKPWEPRLTRELSRPDYSETIVRMLRTNGSEVAREDQNRQTALDLSSTGVSGVRMHTVFPGEGEPDHHHPFWQSLPMVAAMLYELDERVA